MTTMAGYSGAPLVKKLGVKEGAVLAFADAPPGFADALGPLPLGASVAGELATSLDFAMLFVRERTALEQEFPRLMACLQPAGMLWVSWPKKASGVATDLTENVVREVGLANGLVDVKVCAVDETWSGLKFVYRVGDRAEVARAKTTKG
jgi:hypothetical protein